MSELFVAVLNMSLTASYVIVFIIFIRLLLELELGESITTPSGYHVYNADTEKQTFENETTYTFVDYSFLFLEDGVADRLYTTTKKEEFILHLNESYSDSPPAQKVPFFVEVKDGKVINITEKIAFTI